MRLMTLQAIRSKNVKHSEIAAATGLGKPWVTKFLSGKTRFIQEDVMFKTPFFNSEVCCAASMSLVVRRH